MLAALCVIKHDRVVSVDLLYACVHRYGKQSKRRQSEFRQVDNDGLTIDKLIVDKSKYRT